MINSAQKKIECCMIRGTQFVSLIVAVLES